MNDVSPVRRLRNDTAGWIFDMQHQLADEQFGREIKDRAIADLEVRISEAERDLARLDKLLDATLPEDADSPSLTSGQPADGVKG